MPEYNAQQSRFASAFNGYSTLCDTRCDCGRLHFTSAQGHGDYGPGQLEDLQAKAAADPSHYVEETEFDHVDACYVDGRQIVPDCPCERYKKYCAFIEDHAESIARYLVSYFKQKAAEAKAELEVAEKAIEELTPNPQEAL